MLTLLFPCVKLGKVYDTNLCKATNEKAVKFSAVVDLNETKVLH